MRKGVLLMALLSFAFAGVNLVAADVDPYEILNRSFEARGGLENLKNIKTSYTEGTIELQGMGLSGEFKVWTAAPYKERQDIDLGVVKQVGGFDGERAWMLDSNGQLQILDADDAVLDRKVNALVAEYQYADPNSDVFKLHYEGTEEVDGVETYKIRMSNNINNVDMYMFIDTKTYLVIKQISGKGLEKAEMYYSDHRKVGDIVESFSQRIVISAISQIHLMKTTKYEINIDVDSKLFAPPVEEEKDYSFENGKNMQEVDFLYISDHLFLNITLNGQKSLWILDSGAGKTVIDLDYAKELGLELEGNIKGMGVEKQIDVAFTKIPPFNIDGLHFKSQTVASLPIRQMLMQIMGIKIDGILGYDFLSRLITRIDYAENKLTFFKTESFDYKGDGKIVEGELKNNLFVLPMIIDGKYDGEWILDIGATGIAMDYYFAEKHELLDKTGTTMISFGAGGAMESRLCQFESATLGEFTIDNPGITIATQPGEGVLSQNQFAGNIGNQFLRHFTIYLDYENKHVIMEKNKYFNKTVPHDLSGLQLMAGPGGECVIFHVLDKSPGKKAGFAAQDQILSINGKLIEEYESVCKISEFFKNESEEPLDIKIKREDNEIELQLVLSDYLRELK